MYDTYIKKSINQPIIPPKLLERQKLISALTEATAEHSDFKLFLLCAPCGYGKTSLLASFAQKTGFPCSWCFLERVDINKAIFLTTLMTSISTRFPKSQIKINSLLADLQSQLETNANEAHILNNVNMIVDTLASIIETEIVERFAIVICNYHEVHADTFVKRFMNRLLLHLPSRCLLIIESRAVPDLEIAPLLARRQVFGLGSNGLRFSPDEIYQLAHLQGITSFSDTEARKLAETFDGWITGILLGTHLGDLQSFHSDGPASYIWEAPAIRMSRQRLFAYLVNEVFSREPEIYAFLKDCSIFQQMLPDICNNFLDISNALENLNYLEQQGLFVTHNGEGSAITFICHPVLRELLCEELCTQAPEHFYALHSQAAKIFNGIHDYDQAIYHALQSTDNDFAALLIEEAYTRIRDESFPGTVAHWINELPIELINTHPGLLLLNANIYLSSGDYTNALPLLDKATALIKGNNLSIHFDKEDVRLLKARISLAQSRAFFLEENYEQAKIFCRATLSLLSADEIELRADIHLRLGMCALRQGDFIMGIKELQQALQLRRHHVGGSQVARIYSQLANAYHMIGNDALSEHYRTRALSVTR